ncbi:MAG: ATPase, T2SS/T4P/T4SS family [Erysipelotrichaceae bacterium]|nr:ATPase, T2SS/T4P/T4SS family [Erysipelotrichaceae bacterium]MDD3924266.1 ATPase, T2SS/T4P/T4SS family [Erysipelotrichaceae bacterium]
MKVIRLGDILVEEGVITPEQLQEALARQKVVKKRLGTVIMDLGYADEKDTLKALAKRLQIDYLEAPLFSVELDVVKLIPESLARKYSIVPINIKAGALTIATNDPLDYMCLEDISMITGLEVKTVLSPSSEIDKAINRVYSKHSADNIIRDIKDEYNENEVLDMEDLVDDDMAERVGSSPVVKLVNSLILDAYQQNASDIHIEPQGDITRIRFRIDGDLQVYNEVSSEIHQHISTRIKIVSGMNIAEKRIPQDGSFQFKSEFLTVDIRVSSLPTPYGEKIVMRLLGADRNISYELSSLGLSEKTKETIAKVLHLPHGILLVSGPTGSGKTTTLYSMLAQLADVKKAIITIEDPIERKFGGITQVQVNPRSGLTFASGLRSILRQDPDTIMIGEIRDSETAQIAIRAAITGHFVLSTIHTNDALSTVERLVDMGVEPYLVASSVKCVMSQRLVKKICPYCKEEHEVSQENNLLLQTKLKTAFKGKGCSHCNNTGYTGRTAVFEIVLIDANLQRMIANKVGMDAMVDYVAKEKTRMLKDEVMELIEKGTTSVEEGIRILYTID